MTMICRAFTKDQFEDYLAQIQFTKWRPQFVVVHNTSEPSQSLYKSWHNRSNWTPEQWLNNLASYYSGLGWRSAPHLFVAYDFICVLNPLNSQGTHSPSWNALSWGVETVGEFDDEPFDGGVRDNLIFALAALHNKAGLNPDDYRLGKSGLHFHKEDPRTTHKSCPGKNMNKYQLVQDVLSAMGNVTDSHAHITVEAQNTDSSELTYYELTSIKWVQGRLDVKSDGIIGPITREAIKSFQASHNLTVDGIAGPLTRKAIKQFIK